MTPETTPKGEIATARVEEAYKRTASNCGRRTQYAPPKRYNYSEDTRKGGKRTATDILNIKSPKEL